MKRMKHERVPTPLGELILRRAAELGLLQSDVSRRSQMSTSAVHRYIYQEVKPHTHGRVIERLAGALEVSVEDLGKFFPGGNKPSSLVESGIAVSERTAALLRAIEAVSGRPLNEVLNEGQQFENFLRETLRKELDKGNSGIVEGGSMDFSNDLVYTCPERKAEVRIAKDSLRSLVVVKIRPFDPDVIVLECPVCLDRHRVQQNHGSWTLELPILGSIFDETV